MKGSYAHFALIKGTVRIDYTLGVHVTVHRPGIRFFNALCFNPGSATDYFKVSRIVSIMSLLADHFGPICGTKK